MEVELTASSTVEPASLPRSLPYFSALSVLGIFSRAFSASTGWVVRLDY